MKCRSNCGACCIAPSISSPIPGMPLGKAAGERCVQLSAEAHCLIFNQPDRPAVCGAFQASADVCGNDAREALILLTWWEEATSSAA